MFAGVAQYCPKSGYSAVGYLNKYTKIGFNYNCCTFVACDKTKETMTLGDIKPDGNVFMYSTIDFLNPDGTNHYLEEGPDAGKMESYIFIPAEYTGTGIEGWYHSDDTSGDNKCYNDRIIKLGEAYCVSCIEGEEDAAITYSGVVSDEETTFYVELGFNYLGNCAPKQIGLGDITADGNVFMYSTIDFLNPDGTNHYLEEGPDAGKMESYIFIPAEYAGTGIEGWYHSDDTSGDGKCYNDRPVAAGDAFCVSCIDGEEGAAFVLPAALTKGE